MKTEFVFLAPWLSKHLLTLRELEQFFDDRILDMVRQDRQNMDRIMVEIFDRRQGDAKAHPPLKSLGMMPVSTVLQKFK